MMKRARDGGSNRGQQKACFLPKAFPCITEPEVVCVKRQSVAFPMPVVINLCVLRWVYTHGYTHTHTDRHPHTHPYK